jgi:hypothetical protein
MNPGCAPQWVFSTHPPDQIAQVRVTRRHCHGRDASPNPSFCHARVVYSIGPERRATATGTFRAQSPLFRCGHSMRGWAVSDVAVQSVLRQCAGAAFPVEWALKLSASRCVLIPAVGRVTNFRSGVACLVSSGT